MVSVSASVGIAVGPRGSVDALLRDADLALYSAKAAGKDRYILFEAPVQGDPKYELAPEQDAMHTRVSARAALADQTPLNTID